MLPCLGLIFLSGTSAEWAMGQTEGNEGRREAHARLCSGGSREGAQGGQMWGHQSPVRGEGREGCRSSRCR